MNYHKLYSRLKSGDRSVLAELFNTYHHEFIHFVEKNHSFRRDFIEDAFVDAIIIFHDNIQFGRVGPTINSSVKTYLFSIAKFLLLKDYRERREYLFENLDLFFPGRLNDLNIDSNFEENLEKLKECFEKLSTPCKEILIKFYYESSTYDQIVSDLKYSNLDSARTQKYNCIQNLKRLMKNHRNDY